MKRFLVKAATLILCFALLPTEIIFAAAAEKASEPPRYMRELSRLVAATASEDDFGEIRLTLGESEMEVDGEKQEISEDGYAVPFVDEDGILQIPEEAVVGAEAPDESGLLTKEELEAQGYEVQADYESGAVSITEPYNLCRLIVKTEDGKVQDNFGATHEIRVSNNRTVLQYSDKAATAQAAERFAQEEKVLFCEPDSICSVSSAETDREYKCWGSTAAGADQFMATLPLRLPQVTVAVIDTGVDLDHPFLEGRILDNGWDFAQDDDDPDDDHFHGTHCAGIVRDATPDNVKILPVKVMDSSGNGVGSVMAEGITYAADCGAEILSMSFGGSGLSFLSDAITYATEKGAIPVAAAGNSARNLDKIPDYPSCCDGVIAVAAVNEMDQRSSYSNYGSCIDVAAPGDKIMSSVPDGKYKALSGTSMACPLVAGCAALLKSEDMTRTREDVLSILSEKARDAFTPGRDDYTGSGVVYLGEHRPLQGLSLRNSSMTLEPLEGFSICAAFDPPHPSDCTMRYTSTDPAVATVDVNGKVKAAGKGTAQIIATSTQGSFTASVSVTVYRDLEFSQIASHGGKILYFLKSNHTAYVYGYEKSGLLGYYDGSSDNWPFKYQSAPGELVRDIAHIWDEGTDLIISKTDGTVCFGGQVLNGPFYRDPVQTMTDDGEPMTDAVDVQGDYLLRRDGTLWALQNRNVSVPYWLPVTMEDGRTPLSNVRSIHHSGTQWLIVQTNDGCTYEVYKAFGINRFCAMRIRDQKEQAIINNVQDVVSIGKVLLKDEKGRPKHNVYISEWKIILLKDGTLMDQDKSILMQDVVSLSAESIDNSGEKTPVVMALKKDGTVWNVTAQKQIMKSQTVPLNNVVKLCAGAEWHHALCADGTVWTWGQRNGFDTLYGVMGVGWLDSKQVTAKGEVIQPLRELSEDGEVYYDGIQAYTSSQNVPYAMQVVESENTPLTGVMDVFNHEKQMLYYKDDGTIHWSGLIREIGNEARQIAVYAIPMQFFGSKVYLRESGTPDVYSTERLQSIRLDKPAMASTVGDVFSLTATVTPANTYERNILWKSSNPNVADVDNEGNVCAKQTGVVVIRAYSTSNDKIWGQCLLSVEEEAPIKVTLRQAPTKRAYTTDDTGLNTEGGSLVLQYRNGQQRGISIAPEYCSGFDFAKPGEQTVTVTFCGESFSYPITVTDAKDRITGIAWEDYPVGCIGVLDGRFTVPQASVRILRADGTSSVVLLTSDMCSGYDMQTLGEQTVTVTYAGCTCTYTMTVVRRLLWIQEPEKTEIPYGGEWIVPQAAFLAYRDDGSSDVVSLTAEMCTGYDAYKLGEQVIQVQYAAGTLPISVRIMPDTSEVESVSVETQPSKLCYVICPNTWPDVTGGTLCVTLRDGTKHSVPMAEATVRFTPIGEDETGQEKRPVYLDYGGQTASYFIYDINCDDNTIQKAKIIQLPDKTVYAVGETVDCSGGKVYVQLLNGAQGVEDMALLETDAPESFSEAGEYPISVCVGSIKLSFTVTVELTDGGYSSYWRVKPSKTVYCVGEELDASDAMFYVGKSSIATDVTPDMCNVDMETPGYKTVTVTWKKWAMGENNEKVWYKGTLTYDIVVADLVLENEVPEIDVGKCTRVLATFQPVDVDGREILWTSSNPDIATVDAYGRVTGLLPGKVTIVAQVVGSAATASCTVTVVDRESTGTSGDANSDGEVTLIDVAMIRRYLVGGWNAVIDLQNADVNGDGSVDLRDCVYLERYLAGGWGVKL